jgi:hypothetical protein
MHLQRTLPLFLAFYMASGLGLSAAPRIWKSSTGEHSFKADFVKRDETSVTLRGESGKELTIELAKLHPDDSRWLDLHEPLIDSSAVFDSLTFNDTRETATAKLKKSKIVEMTADETFFGRSGMNGAFRSRHKIGDLSAMLYFDWTESGKLKELTLQTEDMPESAYSTTMQASWKEFIELLSSLYGEPVQKNDYPPFKSLVDGSFLPSHLWKLEGGGGVLLGTAKDGSKFQVVVRFTKRASQPVAIP